jgi:autotransporter adhesin
MNTIYRIVWNAATGKWIVASELAKGRKKSSKRSVVIAAALAAGMGLSFEAAAFDPIGAGAQRGDANNLVIGDNASGPAAGCSNLYMPEGATEQGCTTVIGNNASSTGRASTVIGDHASVTGTHGVAVGTYAKAYQYSQAFGTSAEATGSHSTAIGQSAKATRNNATAVGTNATATGDSAVAFGSGAHAEADKSFAMGWNSRATGVGSMAFGYNVAVDAENAIAMGLNAKASSQSAMALGANASANNGQSIAIGANATSGVNGDSTKVNQVALGYLSNAQADRSVAVGSGARVAADAQYGIAIGRSASVLDTGVNSVALGQSSVANRENTVSVGAAGTERQIVNVAAGTANTDAVNVSQLKNTAQSVADAIGGGSTVGADGKVGAPSYSVGGTTVNNVGAAITNIDGRVTTNTGDITDLKATVADAVMYDSAAHDSVTLGGTSASAPVALKNVKAGALTGTSTDAVNGSQLFATNERVTKNETDITNLDGRVTTNEGDIVDIRNKLGSGSIGLVQQAGAGADLTVGAGTDGERVDFADKDGNTRTLASVSEGDLSKDSTEAVNGSQLFATNERVTKNETNITNLDGRVTTNEGDITNIRNQLGNGSIGLVQQASANAAVTVAAATGGTTVDFTGTDGTRQLKGVSEGTDDTDAVNVRQLKSAGLVGDDGNLMDAVVYDTGSNRSSITLGGVAGTTITNVMAGLVAPGSMDAINGSQLWGVQDQINKLGDRVTTIENGAVSPGPGPIAPITGNPHFAANGDIDKPATATGSASVAAGEGAVASGSNSTAIGAGSSATGNNSVAIGAGSVADGDNTVSVGSVGNERRIANVAAGTQRTDAANVGQLQDAMSNVQDWTRGQINGLSKKVDNVQRQANRGIAASAALVNNMPYLPGKVTLNAGVAGYRGQSALGVGVSRWNDSGRFNVNAGISAAQGDTPIFRLGVGVVLGD